MGEKHISTSRPRPKAKLGRKPRPPPLLVPELADPPASPKSHLQVTNSSSSSIQQHVLNKPLQLRSQNERRGHHPRASCDATLLARAASAGATDSAAQCSSTRLSWLPAGSSSTAMGLHRWSGEGHAGSNAAWDKKHRADLGSVASSITYSMLPRGCSAGGFGMARDAAGSRCTAPAAARCVSVEAVEDYAISPAAAAAVLEDAAAVAVPAAPRLHVTAPSVGRMKLDAAGKAAGEVARKGRGRVRPPRMVRIWDLMEFDDEEDRQARAAAAASAGTSAAMTGKHGSAKSPAAKTATAAGGGGRSFALAPIQVGSNPRHESSKNHRDKRDGFWSSCQEKSAAAAGGRCDAESMQRPRSLLSAALIGATDDGALCHKAGEEERVVGLAQSGGEEAGERSGLGWGEGRRKEVASCLPACGDSKSRLSQQASSIDNRLALPTISVESHGLLKVAEQKRTHNDSHNTCGNDKTSSSDANGTNPSSDVSACCSTCCHGSSSCRTRSIRVKTTGSNARCETLQEEFIHFAAAAAGGGLPRRSFWKPANGPFHEKQTVEVSGVARLAAGSMECSTGGANRALLHAPDSSSVSSSVSAFTHSMQAPVEQQQESPICELPPVPDSILFSARPRNEMMQEDEMGNPNALHPSHDFQHARHHRQLCCPPWLLAFVHDEAAALSRLLADLADPSSAKALPTREAAMESSSPLFATQAKLKREASPCSILSPQRSEASPSCKGEKDALHGEMGGGGNGFGERTWSTWW